MTGIGHVFHYEFQREGRPDPLITEPGLLDDAEPEVEAPTTTVWVPVLISVLLHLGISWSLLTPRLSDSPSIPVTNEPIVLRMVPTNPLAPKSAAAEVPPVDPRDSTSSDATSAEPERPPPSPSPPPSLVEVPAVNAPESTADPVSIQLPSVLSLRQIVEDTASRQEQQQPGFTCSPVQLVNEMLDCNNRRDRRFENVPSNPVAELFRRDAAPSVLESSARMTAAAAEEVGANLRAAGISSASIDRLMRQLESIAKEYAAPENEKIEILRDEMLRNDPVWQQRERAMNPR